SHFEKFVRQAASKDPQSTNPGGGSSEVICIHGCQHWHTAAAHSSLVVRIPRANVYRFGDSDNARPVLRAVDWTVYEGESWAVVGSGAGEKTALLEVRAKVHTNSTSFAVSPSLSSDYPFLPPV
ncbi:hypothetical protein BC826DRAFT_1015340, partial [Russula brevipes]